MKMKFRICAVAVLLLGYLSNRAQDIHFSQYYAMPVTLNPALTGNFDGVYRINLIYREQWFGLGSLNGKIFPFFQTPGISADFALLKERLERMHLGAGLDVIVDRSNEGKISEYKINAAVAYHIAFGKNDLVKLGIGLKGGISYMAIKNDFKFANGYFYNPVTQAYEYNPSATGLPQEVFAANNKVLGDFAVGLNTQFRLTQKVRLNAGYSFNNIPQPRQNFISGSNASDTKLGFRHAVHGGFEFDIKERWILIPGVLFQHQSKAQEAVFGLNAGYHINPNPDKKTTFYLGCWYRYQHAVIPKVAFEWKGLRAGFAYDIGLGQLKKDTKAAKDGTPGIAGNPPMAFEISLSYIGRISIPKEDNYLFNPRF